MLVYHGTTPEIASEFVKHGIDCHIPYARKIHGPQDNVAGLFVTPTRSVARRFGLCVLEIEVNAGDLQAPPSMAQLGVSVEDALANQLEPQAFIAIRIESSHIRIIECHENGYSINPFESDREFG
ncbi:hypothetical protein AAKU64_002837 [Undibacterium sp. GrIS 1.8]|uniref:hypothetical protein n=1 Tax=unclassified Undibacterium TaxID=2630295 RepID=UPI00339AF0C9